MSKFDSMESQMVQKQNIQSESKNKRRELLHLKVQSTKKKKKAFSEGSQFLYCVYTASTLYEVLWCDGRIGTSHSHPVAQLDCM